MLIDHPGFVPGWYQATLRVLKRHGFSMVRVPSRLEYRLGVCARLHCGGLRAMIRNGHVIVYVDAGASLAMLVSQPVRSFEALDYALTLHFATVRKYLTPATHERIVRPFHPTIHPDQETL